jgi:hypothetical protein
MATAGMAQRLLSDSQTRIYGHAHSHIHLYFRSTFLPDLAAGSTGYYGFHIAKSLPRRRCDVINFDNFSANCDSLTSKGEYRLPRPRLVEPRNRPLT